MLQFHRDFAIQEGGKKGKRDKVRMHTLVSFGLTSGDSAQMLNISSDYKTTI